jgi:hypothetical protein
VATVEMAAMGEMVAMVEMEAPVAMEATGGMKADSQPYFLLVETVAMEEMAETHDNYNSLKCAKFI